MAGGGAQRVGEVVLEDGGGFCWTSPSGAGRATRGIKINTWQYGVCVYNVTSGFPLSLCPSGVGQ